MAETVRQFSLKHVKHETKQSNTLYSMLLEKNLVDVILCCDSTNISAHRLILSANSSYFKNLFDSLESNRCQIPIIVLKDVPLSDLEAIIEFMYRGEVLVDERHLHSVLKSAELLKVFGLTEVCHALRSRLNNESESETTYVTHPKSPAKRPRISDGIRQKSQKSTDIFANLCNSRVEYRSVHPPAIPSSSPFSSQLSSQQQLRSMVSTAITSKSPTIVKNVILPSEQIHRKTDSNVATKLKESNSVTTVEPIRVISSPVRTSLTPPKNSYSRGTVQKKKTNETWTPLGATQNTCTSLPSTSGIQKKTPIEVLIDDETNESFDDIHDIKPPIFELNQSLSANKSMVVLNIKNGSNKNVISQKRKSNVSETSKSDVKSGLKAIKSRSASISSQSSLPPPPSYRVVQRSSTRLLRNIIKPTSMASTSLAPKGKDNSDDKNKTGVKRDRQPVRRKASKSEIDLKSADNSSDESPEVECPSCGLKFNDDKTWNEHITSAHPPAHT